MVTSIHNLPRIPSPLTIHIATVHASPDVVFRQEGRARSNGCLLIGSVDVDDAKELALRDTTIRAVEEFYQKLSIPVETLLLNSADLSHNMVILARKMVSYADGTRFVLNPSMGRRSLGISLLMASMFVRSFRTFEYEIVIIPMTNRPEILSCPLLPTLVPDEKDLHILKGLREGLSLSEIALKFSIPQPTVSVRVKKLTQIGYVTQDGRKFTPTDIAQFLLEIHEVS